MCFNHLTIHVLIHLFIYFYLFYSFRYVFISSFIIIKYLYKNKTISKISSLALLLLFVFGNTPTQFLHDTFAHHKDYSSGQTKSNSKAQLDQSGLHCNCDHFVVDSSFSIPTFNSHCVSVLLGSEFSSSINSSLFTRTSSFFLLRGPPVVA